MQAYSKYFATYIYIHAYSRYFAAYINIHFGWHFFAISFTFYSYICTHLSVNLIWKAISCYTFMGKEELFLLLIHILKSLFMPYAPILRSIFVPFSAHMHISKALGYLPNTRTLYLPLATYSTTNISTSSRRKETLRCSLHQLLAKGGTLPICAHFHALLHSKSKLGSLGLSTYLGTYPSFYKLSLNSTMAATYAQVNSINKIHRIVLKCHWGISLSTWWAHL